MLSAQQQAQQAQELTPLQEQLDGFRDTLEQQKAAAQKLEQVHTPLLATVLTKTLFICTRVSQYLV